MSTEQQSGQRSVFVQQRSLALIILIGAIVAALIFSSYHLGSRMTEQYTPQIDAVMEVQLHVTTSHLWFEELLSNDAKQSIDDVNENLDQAEHYIDLLLIGGRYESMNYLPLENVELKSRARTVLAHLEQYREMQQRRWKMREDSGPGSELDQQFDAIFNQLVSETDQLELSLQSQSSSAMHSFFINHVLLFSLAILITFSLGRLIQGFLVRQAVNMEQLEQVNHELESEIEKRKQTESLLEKQASTDHLTGILNRSRMSGILQDEWKRQLRYQEPFSLIMFDVDKFKQVNDRFGHQAGDEVLVELTRRVRVELRENDAFARWGGEEFLILLPQTGIEGAEEVAQRCLDAFAERPIGEVGIVTASFGVAVSGDGDRTLEQLLRRVDDALMQAKRGGRKQVVIAPDETA